jgi:hypothetical protein
MYPDDVEYLKSNLRYTNTKIKRQKSLTAEDAEERRGKEMNDR